MVKLPAKPDSHSPETAEHAINLDTNHGNVRTSQSNDMEKDSPPKAKAKGGTKEKVEV